MFLGRSRPTDAHSPDQSTEYQGNAEWGDLPERDLTRGRLTASLDHSQIKFLSSPHCTLEIPVGVQWVPTTLYTQHSTILMSLFAFQCRDGSGCTQWILHGRRTNDVISLPPPKKTSKFFLRVPPWRRIFGENTHRRSFSQRGKGGVEAGAMPVVLPKLLPPGPLSPGTLSQPGPQRQLAVGWKWRPCFWTSCGPACPSVPAMAPGGNGLAGCAVHRGGGPGRVRGRRRKPDPSRPCGASAASADKAGRVVGRVPLATGKQALCLGPGAGATSEQTSHCVRPERSPSRASRSG